MSLPRAYRSRVWNDNWTNFSVLRHGQFDGLLVTSKNSGTHWVKYMLAVALAETHGLPHPPFFSENAVRPYIGWPKDAVTFPELPRLAFSHTIPHRLADWSWSRNLAGLPNYVLCIRHPTAILASHHAKWAYDIQVDWLTYLKGDPAGSAYRCDLYWLARFWNRWGKISKAYPGTILTVHYEDTQADPRATLEAIARHWQIALTPSAIEVALAAGTKDAMEAKTDPTAEPNVLQRRKQSLPDLFSGEALAVYKERVSTLFSFDLGYDLMRPPGT